VFRYYGPPPRSGRTLPQGQAIPLHPLTRLRSGVGDNLDLLR